MNLGFSYSLVRCQLRIHITGNAGAGKTTLAKELASQLSLPVIHLDAIVWKPGWQKTRSNERDQAISTITKKSNWLIEGVSEIVREKADIVVFIDAPRYRCLFHCIKRCFTYGFSTRQELPADCPEISILFRVIKLVWDFPTIVGNQILEESKQHSHYIIASEPCTAKKILLTHLDEITQHDLSQ